MRSKKRKMKPLTKFINYCMAFVCIFSACCLDSDSYIPAIVTVASFAYLAIVGAMYGVFEMEGDY